jgi:hypothetical protein
MFALPVSTSARAASEESIRSVEREQNPNKGKRICKIGDAGEGAMLQNPDPYLETQTTVWTWGTGWIDPGTIKSVLPVSTSARAGSLRKTCVRRGF